MQQVLEGSDQSIDFGIGADRDPQSVEFPGSVESGIGETHISNENLLLLQFL